MNRPSWYPMVFSLLSVFLVTAGVFFSPQQDQALKVIELSSSGFGRGHTLAFSPDGTHLAVGSSLGLHLYDASTMQLSYFIKTNAWVRSLAFSPDGSNLATGSYDTTVRIWRVSDGTLLHELKGHSNWVRAVAFSSDGSRLATASDDNTVRIWSVNSWTTLQELQEGVDGVRALAFSPDGSLLATGGFENIIRLWRVADGTLTRELNGHTGWIRALAFSPNGLWLASGGFDATVRLWNVPSGELLVTRTEHSSSVLNLAFSPDGSLLASASVDTTVRLWSMPSLEPFDLLQGHKDFVYAVAFSPHGRTLASTSVDDTVRLWAVPLQSGSEALQIVSAPKNCTACHHPRPQLSPPRVIEPGCEVCHGEGALVLNWCPFFARSQSDTTVAVTLHSSEGSGVFSQSDSSAVIIFAPGNGEVIYGQAGIANPLIVHGKVFTTENLDDVSLTLDILSGGVIVDSAVSEPSLDGTFAFNLVGNPDGLTAAISQRTGADPCLVCHLDTFDAALPYQGTANLRVTMSVGGEVLAADERLIYMDHGGTAMIPVNVSLEDGTPLQGISVQSDAVLYEWRGRSFSSISDSRGEADLPVEVLERVPVTYQISVPNVIVNETEYESLAPVELVLSPGTRSVPPVTLTVHAKLGSISGHVEGIRSPLAVWIIQSDSGFMRTVSTSPHGDFSLSDLPVAEYLVSFDPGELASQNLSITPQRVDLTRGISVQVQFQASTLQGTSLSGTVTSENDSWIPFAWVTADDQVSQVDPALGIYNLSGLVGSNGHMVVTAPGYFSQSRQLQGSPEDFSLVARPEMDVLPWGTGSIFIPPETIASLNGSNLDFTQGWIWGRGNAQDPLVLTVDNVRIQVPSGSFALERLPAQAAWFYLLKGSASVQSPDGSLLEMSTGQMLRISDNHVLQVVAYNHSVVQALQPVQESPISPIFQPSLWQHLTSGLEKLGVESAKIVTFVTYIIIILSIFAYPLYRVYYWFRQKKAKK